MASRMLLVVTFHFPPCSASGSFRMLGFARHLPKFGWGTAVVAPPRVHWDPVDEALRAQVPAETILYPTPLPRGPLWKPLALVDGHAGWLLRAERACRRAVRELRPDAVLTTGPPHVTHAIGLRLKRRSGLPWVADFRDPWLTKDPAMSICGSYGRPDSPRRRAYERLERAIIRHADAVVSTGPRASGLLADAFPEQAAKMVTVTNGYDPERFRGLQGDPGDGPARPGLTITHAGEMYAGRNPLPFLDAVRDLLTAPGGGPAIGRVRFLGSYAGGMARFEADVRDRGLGAVAEYGGQVPYERAQRAMLGSDILLLLDSPGRRVGIPAKAFEYLGAGRPVLALAEPDGDLAWALREGGLPHRIAPPGDVAAIKRALVELAAEVGAGPRDGRARGGRFTREEVAGQLAEVLDRCVGEAGAEAGRNGTGEAVPNIAEAIAQR
jgi:glycosyltransferase involved in cell wall biosynthesis